MLKIIDKQCLSIYKIKEFIISLLFPYTINQCNTCCNTRCIVKCTKCTWSSCPSCWFKWLDKGNSNCPVCKTTSLPNIIILSYKFKKYTLSALFKFIEKNIFLILRCYIIGYFYCDLNYKYLPKPDLICSNSYQNIFSNIFINIYKGALIQGFLLGMFVITCGILLQIIIIGSMIKNIYC